MVVVIKQPVGSVYVIGVPPAEIPRTEPVSIPIVAIPVFPLCQVPPILASDKVTDAPIHTFAGPVILDGNGFMTTGIVMKQLVVVN